MAASPRFDVAIAGGGPAGAAVAYWLARAGCRVALIERSRLDAARVGESLAPGVQPLLAELGAWPAFLALAPLPSFGTRSAWGSPDAAAHAHLASPYLTGWHVDRLALDRLLVGHAALAGAEVRLGARIAGCAPRAPGAPDDAPFALQLAPGGGGDPPAALTADLVIDATGRAGQLARRLGAQRVVLDHLVGVAVPLDDPGARAHPYTLVEAAPGGWWYTAPIAGDRSIAMAMTDGDLARDLAAPGAWRAALDAAPLTRARLGAATARAAPRTCAAQSQRLRRAPGDRARWLAVGDAALAVDPLTGSGVVRALRTARAAAAAALAALGGDPDALAAYDAERDRECTAYLHERAAYYAAEQRWPTAPFWARRAPACRAAA